VDADYLLDVRSGGWMFAYYPTHWGKYWVGYSVQVQLIDKRAGRLVIDLLSDQYKEELQDVQKEPSACERRAPYHPHDSGVQEGVS
jgi:hypothetical protein